MITPVAAPRRQPRCASRSTAGSIANERNRAVARIVKTFPSRPTSHSTNVRATPPTTIATISWLRPSLIAIVSQDGMASSPGGSRSAIAEGYPYAVMAAAISSKLST